MKKLCLRLIRWYKRNISPNRPPSCRFLPTCSEYTYQAIERFGSLKGGLLGLWRIMRCNPFCKWGYDPVPQRWPRDKQTSSVLHDARERKNRNKSKKKEE